MGAVTGSTIIPWAKTTMPESRTTTAGFIF
ncbi:unnamed protein product [Acanthoscelides obtectus]|uniref:Uncharacterized protein n=1 Tax=Acanthoscelides obtectus TaxID=200917 RepID=A0A9P0K3Z0_ACAOB|nr:unnamed protein product [Acanthoscelides obtectus]CAK1633835.1 hypothetical protein AOBTE_LOCUS8422 [Acanthoscelides obtectus]